MSGGGRTKTYVLRTTRKCQRVSMGHCNQHLGSSEADSPTDFSQMSARSPSVAFGLAPLTMSIRIKIHPTMLSIPEINDRLGSRNDKSTETDSGGRDTMSVPSSSGRVANVLPAAEALHSG